MSQVRWRGGRALISGIAVAALASSVTRSATLDSVASVVGTAIDAQYDGVFESLSDDYAAGDFATTIAARLLWNLESERRLIVEFEIDSIPRAAPVTNATLLMRAALASNQRGVYVVFGLEGDGLLSTGDATATSPLAGAQPRSVDLSVDVTAFVRDLVDEGAPYAGFTGKPWRR